MDLPPPFLQVENNRAILSVKKSRDYENQPLWNIYKYLKVVHVVNLQKKHYGFHPFFYLFTTDLQLNVPNFIQ